jgi:hypothetical protein
VASFQQVPVGCGGRGNVGAAVVRVIQPAQVSWAEDDTGDLVVGDSAQQVIEDARLPRACLGVELRVVDDVVGILDEGSPLDRCRRASARLRSPAGTGSRVSVQSAVMSTVMTNYAFVPVLPVGSATAT